MVPELVLYVGPMFSGKSTRLVRKVNRCKIGGKNVISFKPAMDNRYTTDGYIVTHDDTHTECFLITKGEQLIKIFDQEFDKNNVDCVAIDEGFMIDDIAAAVIELFYNRKVSVYISSLDLSFSLTPFEEIATLLTHATKVKKCKAICPTCGENASYTMRKVTGNNSQITVGGSELYEPRCLTHYTNLNI